jgi:acyl-CoA dehydrogenase
MHLEAAKLATYHAASLYDRSSPSHAKYDSSITQHAVGIACNSAKYLAAEAAFLACERSVMSMGGMGYAAEYHVERYLRECFVPRIAPVSRVSMSVLLGKVFVALLTSCVQEMIMNFVAEKALKLPRSY